MAERIVVGDRVSVFWERVEPEHNVKVVEMGEPPWVVERLDGTIIYVQGYAKMVKSNPSAFEGKRRGPMVVGAKMQTKEPVGDAEKIRKNNEMIAADLAASNQAEPTGSGSIIIFCDQHKTE